MDPPLNAFVTKIAGLNVFPCKLIYLYHFWTDSICCTKYRIKEKHPAKDMSAGCTDFQINTNTAFKIPYNKIYSHRVQDGFTK